MMFRLFDTLSFTLERIKQHRVLVLWVIVGLSVATTLAMSLSLYVDSVYSDLLQSRLGNPPYAFRFRYLGAWNGNVTTEDVSSASAAIQNRMVQLIGLPVQRDVRFVRGGSWSIALDSQSLGTFSLGTLDGATDQMTIVDGQWPPPQSAGSNDPLPVLAPETMLETMGLQVGDQLTAQGAGGATLKVQIAALWRPVDANDPAWIFPPKFFDQILLVRPDDLGRVLAGNAKPVDEVDWYLVFNGAGVRTSDVSGLLSSIANGQREVGAVLPGIRFDLSPVDGLKAFNKEVTSLTQQLFIIIAPVGGLVMYFVSLVADLLVSRQQAEDVKLRSRGMSRRALLTIHILMWLLLVGAALVVGIIAAPEVVRLVGQTSSFLSFTGTSSVSHVVFTPQAIGLGAITALIAASSGLILAWRTTRQNINSYQRAVVREGKAWWQRAYLDLLMLLPAGYVLYTLYRQGGIVANAETPFSDPLTFVGPTLFALGMTLLFLRIWPWVLAAAARLIGLTRNISLLMALRELTRAGRRYRGALLMMAFTLSLTGFTASMASTLDRSLEDTVNYQVGADLVLVTAAEAQTESSQDTTTGQTTYTVTGYNLPPTADLMTIKGVANVSRVGRYPAQLTVNNQNISGTILGVDRASMAAVTLFRNDYASQPPANLFNELAGQRTGILIDRQAAQKYNLAIGQQVTLQVQALNTWYQTRVPIVDYVDYFPTLNPGDGFFAIGNLDPIFELVGTVLPYDYWLSLYPGTSLSSVLNQVQAINFPVLHWQAPTAALEAARAQPARRGVLGFLSVGFVASIALTLIAAIIQNTASFQGQTTQLGTLRAMGLGSAAVGVYVVILEGLAALSGILSGTSIGVGTTLLFLPLLDFSGGLPPYLIRVAWNDTVFVYAVFAGVLFFVTLLTTILLSRQRVATIIRLGEA
jgi:putative ABC transport system permease protein